MDRSPPGPNNLGVQSRGSPMEELDQVLLKVVGGGGDCLEFGFILDVEVSIGRNDGHLVNVGHEPGNTPGLPEGGIDRLVGLEDLNQLHGHIILALGPTSIRGGNAGSGDWGWDLEDGEDHPFGSGVLGTTPQDTNIFIRDPLEDFSGPGRSKGFLQQFLFGFILECHVGNVHGDLGGVPEGHILGLGGRTLGTRFPAFTQVGDE